MEKILTSKDSIIVQFGNWIFHYRNYLFPLFYLALFIPSESIFRNNILAEIIGFIIIASGIFIRSITIGLVYIIRGGKNRRIYAETLVTEGIYSVCRNPMYLGNILLLLGFGVFANSLLFILIFFPLFLLFYYGIMKAEEEFLSKKFGTVFEEYRSSVNALVPSISKLKFAFKDHNFDFKRVIKKEYNSLFIYFSGILLLILYKERMSFISFSVIFSIVLISYLLIKYFKRKKAL